MIRTPEALIPYLLAAACIMSGGMWYAAGELASETILPLAQTQTIRPQHCEVELDGIKWLDSHAIGVVVDCDLDPLLTAKTKHLESSSSWVDEPRVSRRFSLRSIRTAIRRKS